MTADGVNNALFSASNSGGVGTNDIDGGECIATSPVHKVTAASDVSNAGDLVGAGVDNVSICPQ